MPTVDAERKVAFVLKHGLRAERRTAEAFVASTQISRFTLADYQQRVEAMRVFGWPLEGLNLRLFCRRLTSHTLPRLLYVAQHACGRHSSCCVRERSNLCVLCALATGRRSTLLSPASDIVTDVQLLCRPNWGGTLAQLFQVGAHNIQSLVDARVSFEEFREASGADVDAALAQLNSRLAARGAHSPSVSPCCGLSRAPTLIFCHVGFMRSHRAGSTRVHAALL